MKKIIEQLNFKTQNIIISLILVLSVFFADKYLGDLLSKLHLSEGAAIWTASILPFSISILSFWVLLGKENLKNLFNKSNYGFFHSILYIIFL